MEHLISAQQYLIERQRQWSSPYEIECNDYLLRLVAGWIATYSTPPSRHGTSLGLAVPALLVFAAFKTYSERPKPVLSLIPNEQQSSWGQSRQPSGQITNTILPSLSGHEFLRRRNHVVRN